jgi:hypothetical protein
MRIKRRILASVLVVLTGLSGTAATAQVPFLGGSLKRLAYQAAAKQLAPMVSEASPINLDWNNIYPTVDAPPGGPFHSIGDRRKIREQYRYMVAQMAKHPNAPVPLRPGDYVFFFRAFCTHAGPQGIPAHATEPWPEQFQLAPLKGRRASILPALYARGQQAHIPYQQTQILVWSITNGVSYAQMPPEQQATLNKLVPQYKGLMEGDPVQAIRDRWATMRHKMPLLPSLDAAVDKMGAVGATVRSLEEAQRATIANANNFEQSKATLAPQTIMSPAPVPAKAWSKINDRVYAKVKLPRNYHGIGSIIALLVRVLPTTATASTERPAKGSARDFDTIASSYSDSAGQMPTGDWGNWTLMPADQGKQPLTLGPTDTGITGVGPATTGDGPPPDTPPGKKLGNDYLNNGIQWWNQTFNGTGTSNGNTSNGGPGVSVTGNDPTQDGQPTIFTPTLGKPGSGLGP